MTEHLCQCGCGSPTNLATRNRRKNGALIAVKGQPERFAPRHSPRGDKSSFWKGGRRISHNGYVMIYAPDHPRVSHRATNRYVFEHILAVEKAIGHYLRPTAEVHHVDENKQNNANTNLVACNDSAYHKLLHQRQRALEASGDPDANVCDICGGYDRQDQMTVMTSRRRAYHRACAADKERQSRRARLAQ